MQRPDLTNVDPVVLAYIEYLEKKAGSRPRVVSTNNDEQLELHPERAAEALPAEHETTTSIITVSTNGTAKRTYRHLYTRQHRGGMGVFGVDVDHPDHPLILSSAEENQNLLLFTSRARVFSSIFGSDRFYTAACQRQQHHRPAFAGIG
jgi:DNA gyrase/topoisomerase IV subunit A